MATLVAVAEQLPQRPSSPLARRLDSPPEGTCALLTCRRRAEKWVGRIDSAGRVRIAVGVCQAHYDQLQSGQLEQRELGLLGS